MLRITNVEIYRARKFSFLANAKVTLSDERGNSITITDLRLLKNKCLETWVALPNSAVPEGKTWSYEPTVILSRTLQLEVFDAVLAAYEKWASEQAQTAPSGGAR